MSRNSFFYYNFNLIICKCVFVSIQIIVSLCNLFAVCCYIHSSTSLVIISIGYPSGLRALFFFITDMTLFSSTSSNSLSFLPRELIPLLTCLYQGLFSSGRSFVKWKSITALYVLSTSVVVVPFGSLRPVNLSR